MVHHPLPDGYSRYKQLQYLKLLGSWASQGFTCSWWPRSKRLLGVSGSSRLPTRSTMAGTAASPTDRRQPHPCILEVPVASIMQQRQHMATLPV